MGANSQLHGEPLRKRRPIADRTLLQCSHHEARIHDGLETTLHSIFNGYYHIAVLKLEHCHEHTDGDRYFCWVQWGRRDGSPGMHSLMGPFLEPDPAITAFKSVFKTKATVGYANRANATGLFYVCKTRLPAFTRDFGGDFGDLRVMMDP